MQKFIDTMFNLSQSNTEFGMMPPLQTSTDTYSVFKKCKNKKPKSTGEWMIANGKSWAECKRCMGWYETTLLKK